MLLKRVSIGERLVWIAAVCFLLIGLLLKVNRYYGPPLTSEARAYRQAQRAFASSRAGEAGSYEFLTFGLRKGMTEADVDRSLPEQVCALRHGRDEHQDPLDRSFINTYEFEWGPKQSPASTTALCSEVLHVYFNGDGRATRIVLQRFGHVPLFGPGRFEGDLRD